MTDILSSEERSKIMSRIKGRNTKPEKIVRSILFKMGYRFRLHCKHLPGTPDIVLLKYRTVIFVHGCFWHSHEGCKDASKPKSNIDFWHKKLSENRIRDAKNIDELTKLGFTVIVVWECELKNLDLLREKLVNSIKK